MDALHEMMASLRSELSLALALVNWTDYHRRPWHRTFERNPECRRRSAEDGIERSPETEMETSQTCMYPGLQATS